MEQVRDSVNSWVELDAQALRYNLDQLAGVMGPGRSLGLVVKGNAYGHGLSEIASLAARHHGTACFFVGSLAEAITLRALGIQQDICALVPADSALLSEAIDRDIQLVCPDLDFLLLVNATAQCVNKRARVHIKVDTGLSRLGVCGGSEVCAITDAIKQLSHVELWGVMTHFADTAGADLTFTREQSKIFADICAELRADGLEWRYTHAGASGALEVTREDSLVRVGTAVYGYWKSHEQRDRCRAAGLIFDLKPVLTWKSRIFHTKYVVAGCSIGYGHELFADTSKTLAVVPVGYADGYPRALSNSGSVMIHGVLAPVIGRVGMNLLTIDVSHIPSVTTGDEVVLLGAHGGVMASDLAARAETVTLDILTGISPAIKRVVINV